jgi:hypothetical protein
VAKAERYIASFVPERERTKKKKKKMKMMLMRCKGEDEEDDDEEEDDDVKKMMQRRRRVMMMLVWLNAARAGIVPCKLKSPRQANRKRGVRPPVPKKFSRHVRYRTFLMSDAELCPRLPACPAAISAMSTAIPLSLATVPGGTRADVIMLLNHKTGTGQLCYSYER